MSFYYVTILYNVYYLTLLPIIEMHIYIIYIYIYIYIYILNA